MTHKKVLLIEPSCPHLVTDKFIQNWLLLGCQDLSDFAGYILGSPLLTLPPTPTFHSRSQSPPSEWPCASTQPTASVGLSVSLNLTVNF